MATIDEAKQALLERIAKAETGADASMFASAYVALSQEQRVAGRQEAKQEARQVDTATLRAIADLRREMAADREQLIEGINRGIDKAIAAHAAAAAEDATP